MMEICKNKKNIACCVALKDNIIKQFVGLRFKKQTNLIFEFKKEKKITMDMFFVFYSIDIIFLNKEKKVIELKPNFKPFEIYSTKNKVKYAVELKEGFIKENNIRLKDRLDF